MKHPVYNLKSRVNFPYTCCHDQQKTLLSPCNGLNSTVYCNSLIITWRICILAGMIRLFNNDLLLRCNTRLFFITLNKFLFCRELIQIRLSFLTRKKIMLCKSISIRTIGKKEIQHPSISNRLS